MSDSKEIHGWTAVPRDPVILFKSYTKSEPKPLVVNDIPLPDSSLSRKVLAYAEKELSEQTFNHSMRVYYYGGLSYSYISPQCYYDNIVRFCLLVSVFPSRCHVVTNCVIPGPYWQVKQSKDSISPLGPSCQKRTS